MHGECPPFNAAAPANLRHNGRKSVDFGQFLDFAAMRSRLRRLNFPLAARAYRPAPQQQSTFNMEIETIMAKPATQKIRLNSTAGTGYYYVTKKNPRNITEKMVFKKYDPVVRKHVEFKEGKIK